MTRNQGQCHVQYYPLHPPPPPHRALTRCEYERRYLRVVTRPQFESHFRDIRKGPKLIIFCNIKKHLFSLTINEMICFNNEWILKERLKCGEKKTKILFSPLQDNIVFHAWLSWIFDQSLKLMVSNKVTSWLVKLCRVQTLEWIL